MSPLPAGFKLNGIAVEETLPPTVKKISAILDKLPSDELLDSNELAVRVGVTRNGGTFSHPALLDYRERISSKLFWGSKQAILDLRAKLNEETSD